jgi:hypothetical protein
MFHALAVVAGLAGVLAVPGIANAGHRGSMYGGPMYSGYSYNNGYVQMHQAYPRHLRQRFKIVIVVPLHRHNHNQYNYVMNRPMKAYPRYYSYW